MSDWQVKGKKKLEEKREQAKLGCAVGAAGLDFLTRRERQEVKEKCEKAVDDDFDGVETECSTKFSPKWFRKEHKFSKCVTKKSKEITIDPFKVTIDEGLKVLDRRLTGGVQVDKSQAMKDLRKFTIGESQYLPNESEGSASADIVDTSVAPIEGEFKKGYGDSIVIPYSTEKNKSKGIFQTPKNEKDEDTLTVIKANVQCKDCGWTTETEDLRTAKKFRRGEKTCPKCSSTRFKMKNAFPYTIKAPYYLLEEEFRGEMINTIYDNVNWIDIVDCRKDKCIEPVLDGEFPLYPQTGDILYLENGKFKSIELKITTLNPQKDSKVGGLCYRVLRSVPVKLSQLELIKRGVMKLVILAEFVEDISELGVSSVAETRERAFQDIRTIRDALGRDEVTYAYLIIDRDNWEDYEFYFDNLRVGEKKDEWGNVIERRKQVRFPKLWREFTESETRYRAKKSELCLEITKKLFGLE